MGCYGWSGQAFAAPAPDGSTNTPLKSCHHPLGWLARSCNSGHDPVGPGHHGASMAETSCEVRGLPHSRTFWTPMFEHLLTHLSVHSYSLLFPTEQHHLQVGWVRTYLELQFASNILSSWEDGLAL